MIAKPRGVERGTRGDGQHSLCAIRMERRHVARQCRITRQCHIVSELHRKAVAVAHHPIGHARRRIEHNAPIIGMVAGTDRHRHGVGGSESRSEQEAGNDQDLSQDAGETPVGPRCGPIVSDAPPGMKTGAFGGDRATHVMPTESLPRAKAGVGIHDCAASTKARRGCRPRPSLGAGSPSA